MASTKEQILLAALSLFAKVGYEAASVSQIAGALGMTKGALYKHYQNKRDIFESILRRMEQLDAENARTYAVPEDSFAQMPATYGQTAADALAAFSVAQFRRWTEEPFSAAFRRMLTIEQFCSPEGAALYQQYLAGGPLTYLTDLFREMTGKPETAEQLALRLYAPMLLLMSIYDNAPDKAAVTARAQAYIMNTTNAIFTEP